MQPLYIATNHHAILTLHSFVHYSQVVAYKCLQEEMVRGSSITVQTDQCLMNISVFWHDTMHTGIYTYQHLGASAVQEE